MANFPKPWKIWRELKRIPRQMWRGGFSLSSYLFGASYYDLVHAGKARRTVGDVPASRKAAVYLIFPSYGLKQSHLNSLSYLVSKGYSPVVVSNLKLTSDERALLLPKCESVIERHNFGYDFGGYRDGILSLRHRAQDLDRLLLVNDSTWFPLPGSHDWIDAAESLNVDLAGAATNYGHPRVDVENFREIEWNYSTGHKNFHYCSFALLFSKHLLSQAAFWKFWKRFPLTNDKKRTVRRGEIGLSKWILKHGYTHGVTYDIAALDRDLAALDDERLREVSENLIVPEDWTMNAYKHTVLARNPTRDELIRLVLTGVARQGSSYALAAYSTTEIGFPFLKKSPVWLNQEASDITLALARGLDGKDADTIVDEILELREKRANGFRDSQMTNRIQARANAKAAAAFDRGG